MKYLVIILSLCLLFAGCFTTHTEPAKTTGIVIVGMATSAKYGKCEGSDVDAKTMNGILSLYGVPTVLTNEKATKKNVLDALNNAKENDLLIFYYSGHGGSDKIGDVSDELDGKNEYLCLYNGYFLDNDIWNIVCTAKGRVFLIFDCCHSETMFRYSGINFDRMFFQNGSALPRATLGNVQMLCWSGCADNTYSYGDKSGGYLTRVIANGYKPDISYEELWKYVKKNMPQYQVPKKTTIGEDFSGRVFR